MILPIKNCPSCDSLLEWTKDQIFCKNSGCPAKGYKQLEHFAKTLKIKGLGPSTIEKLEFVDIKDIYEATLDYLTVQLKSEKLAIKLFEEINRSKQEPLNTVLPAFGIPLVGRSASDKLSSVTTSLFDIDEETCKQAGLGPKVTQNLMHWIENDFNRYDSLPFSFEFETVKPASSSKGVVCITGKLNSYSTKAEATKDLLAHGYTVKDSLTKDVTILVNESGKETAKTKKASESGVTLIDNLKTFIGEN